MSALVFFVALAVATVAVSRWLSVRKLRLPPGPPPDPFLGNIRQMAFENQEQRFAEWGKVYGDVMHAKIFSRSVLILNSLKAAQDLLEKRSRNYSCRPRLVLISELMGWSASLPNIPYGDKFRKHRRWMMEYFNEKAIVGFQPLQRSEVNVLLMGFLNTPQAFMSHVRRLSAGVIMNIAYGHTVQSVDELYVRLAEEAGEATVTAGSPGSMLVDFFPILKYMPTWMPGAGFKRTALEARKKVRLMHDVPYEMVRDTMANGAAIPSFTSSLLVENENAGTTPIHSEEDIKGAAGTLFAAASDTTSATMMAFVLAMTMHPDVLAKAQEEIDRVVGLERLPDFNDRDSLPYVQSVVLEVYRWHAAVPLCVPHRTMNVDQYRGYDIPANAMVIPNVWAMMRDEEVYSQSDEFNPDRFLNLSPEEADRVDPRKIMFGFGRRQCPGQYFADKSVWLAVASIIAAFTISPPVGENDKPIFPAGEFTSGFVRHPKPFGCEIRPRSQRVVEMLNQSFNAA
ncbi:cytochrome P450 monooxygenase [Amylostereum chailletii]|nr:cytochrome P450 monooxygenase [Amylostereum chailletii]